MVALGDPRLADPFDIDCAAKGHGRWADERNWIYDFDDDLPAGVRCTFKLRNGLPTATAPRWSALARFNSTPADRRFALRFRTTAARSTRIRCSCSRSTRRQRRRRSNAPRIAPSTASRERVPVRVLEGDERNAILDQRRELGYSYYQILWKDGVRSNGRVRDRSLEDAEAQLVGGRLQAQTAAERHEDADRLGRGHRSAERNRHDGRPEAAVRRAAGVHRANLQCERVNARAGLYSAAADSSAVQRAGAARRARQRSRIVTADGSTLAPEPVAARRGDGRRPDVQAAVSENQSVRVQLPANIVDDIGRDAHERRPVSARSHDRSNTRRLRSSPVEFGILESERRRRAAGDAAQPRNTTAGETSRTHRQTSARNGRRGCAWPSGCSASKTPTSRAARGPTTKRRKNRSGPSKPPTIRCSRRPTPPKRSRFRAPTPTASARPFEVVGIPLAQRGFYVVELESRRLGAGAARRRSAALRIDRRARDQSQRAFQMGSRIVARVGHASRRRNAGRKRRRRNHRLLHRRSALARSNRSRRHRQSSIDRWASRTATTRAATRPRR